MLMSMSSLSCVDNQEFLVFAVSIIPKAEIIELKITHSIKDTECNLWHYLEKKVYFHSPHNLVWGLVSLYTSAATEKSKGDLLYNVLILN